MKFDVWNQRRSLALIASLPVVLALLFVWGASGRPVVADGMPWTLEKFAEPAQVPPGGVAKYSIVLSRSVGTLVTPIYIFDHYDALLGSPTVSVDPSGAALWDSSTPGYITFTVYSLSSVITMSFESPLSGSAVSGDIISNTATVSDGVNMLSSNVATFTVSQPPATQITSPANGDVLNVPQGGVLVVGGRSWMEFDPVPFPDAPILTPIDNFGGSGNFYIRWSSVAGATSYILQEAEENGSFIQKYAGPDLEFFVSAKPVGVYSYRVQAFNAQGRPSRWSNVQTVTVTTAAQYSVVDVPSVSSLPAGLLPLLAEPIVVEVSMDAGNNWHTAVLTPNVDGWWDWTYNWIAPEQTAPAAYPVMARARYAAGGDFGPTDVITFTLFNGYPAFAITKQGPDTVFQNQKIFYTLTITNTGNMAATQVVVTDTLPTGVSYISSTNGGVLQGGVVRWALAELAVGTPVHFVLAVKPNVEGLVTNSAYRVSSEGGYHAVGTVSVSTLVKQHKVYMPLILKRWPPVPYPPTLSATTPDANGNFTVSWVYGSYPNVPAPTSYVLQEALDASFTGATEYPMDLTMSKAFTKVPGTYYYRVRGINQYGNGEWSNVVSVVVVAQNRIYEFNTTGNTESWAVRRYDGTPSDIQDYGVKAQHGSLYTYLWGRYDEMFVSPMQEGPTVPYTIRTRVAFVNGESIDGNLYTPKTEMAYGIIFNGNSGTPCPADRTTAKGAGCLSHYYRLLVVYNQGEANFKWNLKRIDYHDPADAGKGVGVSLIDWRDAQPSNPLDWNEWKIVVTNDTTRNIKIYLNNTLIGEASDRTYVADRHFGTMMVSPAFGQVAAKWDWFRVEK